MLHRALRVAERSCGDDVPCQACREDFEACCRLRLPLRYGPSHGTQLRTPLRQAWFLINLAFPHLFLKPGTLDYPAETTHCLLD
jgi:hypothetical protein